MKVKLLLLMFLVFTILGASSVSYGDEIPVATYTGEEGIKIISYASTWNTKEKLKLIYDELLNNAHGPELHFFEGIYLYPNDDVGYASLYYDSYKKVGNEFVFYYGRYIEIYNCLEYDTIEELARIIAHEYGHHFMLYYMLKEEKKDIKDWVKTDYGALRQLEFYPEVTYLGNTSKPYSHEWDIAEIIADDYVQFYGSDLARATRSYDDVVERVANKINRAFYYYYDYNVLPQENLDLKIATEVEGLAEYFSQLTGIDPHKNEKINVPKPYLSKINTVFKGFKSYEFSWGPVKDGEKVGAYTYTLLYYKDDNNDYPIVVKTVDSGEPLKAIAGSAVDLKSNTGILRNLEGNYVLLLLVEDKYGSIHQSEKVPITITAKDNAVKLFTDITPGYWAEQSIYKVANKGVIEGYLDSSFQPEKGISRAEFMTFMIRSMSEYKVSENVNGKNWFIYQGYHKAAMDLGFLSKTDTDYFKNITRGEIASVIYKALKYKNLNINIVYDSPLTDIKNSVYKHEISVANYFHIIDGYPDKTYGEFKHATRAEAIKLIEKFMVVVGYF